MKHGAVCSAALTVALVVVAAPAAAVVEGTAPSKVANWRLFGQHSATGATLMAPGPVRAEINSVLLTSATAQITDLPFDAEVVGAFLFWSGATPRTNRSGPPDGPDRDADFTLPDGTFINDLSVDTDPTGFGRCVETSMFGGFYYCRRDVTDLVVGLGPGNANGIYELGDVDADAGLTPLDPRWPSDPQITFAQAKYAGWSLILVWRSSTLPVRRDVVLYDGFIRLDEVIDSLGQHTFTVDGFEVGSPALGKITVFGLEGDRQLGVPPQDSTGCPTCFDFISYRTASAPGAVKLFDGANPPNNSFNSSWNGQASIDIDTYNLDGLLTTGDSTAQITLSSGDGILGGGGGGLGESFFVGWVIMTLDTLTPNFAGVRTKMSVAPAVAGAGQTLYYTIDVVNEGSKEGTNVVLQAAIPPNTTYVAGSTTLDGVPVSDVSGTSPLVGGLPLGNIPTDRQGDNSRQVVFAVLVGASACGGTVEGRATVTADGTEPSRLGPAVTSIEAAALATPTKIATLFPPGPTGPGAAFWYTIRLANAGTQAAGGVRIVDELPPEIAIQGVLTDAPWSLVGSRLEVTDLAVPAGGDTEVVLIGRVLSVPELAAIGIAEADIDGRLVTNQARVSGGCAPEQVTDDPTLSGSADETVFPLVYAPILSASSKSVADDNGAPAEPDDVLTYTIDVQNSGNRVVDVVVTDAIPANTQYVAGSTRVDGVPVADVSGTSPLVGGLTLANVPYIGDNDRRVTFQVTIDSLVANRTVIGNRADLTVPEAPDVNVTVVAPNVMVIAEPRFDTSRKSVVPQASYRPGDIVEYTLEIINSGNRPATSVVVSDPLPPELTFVSADNGGVELDGVITWTLGDLAVDATVVLTVQAQLTSPLDHGTRVSNGATVDAAEVAPHSVPEVVIVITSAPGLVLTKQDIPPASPYRPGDPVRYRLVVSNTGDMVARSIVITDPIDAALTGLSTPTGRVAGSDVVWDETTDTRLVSLAPGDAPIEVTLDATLVSPLANGTVVDNQARVVADAAVEQLSDDPDTPSPGDPTRLVVTSEATLAFTKRVEDLSPGTPLLPGDRVRYTLELTAGGDAPLEDVVVTDPVDPSLTAVDATASSGIVAAGTVTWSTGTGADLARLDPGESRLLTFDATIATSAVDGTLVQNQASAQATALGGPVPSDGDSATPGAQSTDFVVVSRPVLAVLKSVALEGDDDPEFNPGDLVRYSIRVENVGTGVAGNVSLTDPIDANLTVVDPGTARVAGSTLRWAPVDEPALSALAAGQGVDLTFTARIVRPLDGGTVIANQATGRSNDVSGDVLSDDPATPDPADATLFEVIAAPVLVVSKTVTDAGGAPPLIVRPGDSLRYTIRVENRGDANADDVVVRDPIPAELENVVTVGGRQEGSNLVWDATTTATLAQIAPDTGVDLVFTADVVAPLPNGTPVSNQAAATSAEVLVAVLSDDPSTTAPLDPTVVTVVSASDLGASTKMVTDASGSPITEARPNDVIRYELAIVNRGDAPANNVTVTDVLPAALSLISAPGAAVNGQTLTWDGTSVSSLTSIAAGGSVALSIEAQVVGLFADDEVVINQASIEADDVIAPVLTDADTATVAKEETVFTVRVQSDVSGPTKRFVDPLDLSTLTTVRPGRVIRVDIEVSNEGDGVARNVVIEDPLDTSQLTSVVIRDGGELRSGIVTWDAGDLLPGETKHYRVDAEIRYPADAGSLINQATVTRDGIEAFLTDDPGQPGLEDPTVLIIDATPDLSATTKDVVGRPDRRVGPSEAVTYRITVRNDGDGNATGVAVSDVLSPLLSFDSASDGGVWASASRTVTWDLGALPGNGGERTVTLVATAAAGLANGTPILNQAVVVADGQAPELSDDPIAPAADNPTTLVVLSAARFALTKTMEVEDPVEPGRLQPGDRVRMTLQLENTGNAPALAVRVEDPLDDAVWTDPQGTFVDEAGTLVWDSQVEPGLADVQPGETVELIFSAQVAPGVADGQRLENRAVALSAQAEQPAEAVAELLAAFPRLEIDKTVTDDNGPPVQPGDALAYAITVRNVGSVSARGLEVVDSPDSALVDIVTSPTATNVGSTWRWSIGDLGAGAEATVRLDAVVASSTADGVLVENGAVVRGTGLTDVAATPVTVEIVAAPDLSSSFMRLGESTGQFAPLDTVAYEITARNTGTGDAEVVVIEDVLPAALEIVGASDGGVVDGQRVTWTLPDLGPGQSRTVSVSGRIRGDVVDGTVVTNRTTLTAPVESPEPVQTEPVVFVVTAKPDFSVVHLRVTDENGGVVAPGDVLTYELRAINGGTADAEATLARVPIPAHTVYVPFSTLLNGTPLDDEGGAPAIDSASLRSRRSGTPVGVVLRDDGTVPTDEESVLSFQVQVEASTAPGTLISTQATVLAATISPAGSDDPTTPDVVGDPTVVVVGGGGALAVSKRALRLDGTPLESGDVAPVGSRLRYRIVAQNTGDAPLARLVVSDRLPSELTAVPGTLSRDGVGLTDIADGDGGSVIGGLVAVEIDGLAPQGSAVVEVTAQVTAGPVIVNQAVVTDGRGRSWPSDGDPRVVGAQPTVTPVAPGVATVRLSLDAWDADGGRLLPGDPVRLALTVTNEGASDAPQVFLELERIAGLVLGRQIDDGGAQLLDAEIPAWTLAGGLRSGQAARIEYEAEVDGAAVEGDVMEVRGRARFGGVSLATDVTRLLVGAGAGTARLVGEAFWDRGEASDHYDPAVDGLLAGFSVVAVPDEEGTRPGRQLGDLRATAIREAIPGPDARWAMSDLPAGRYRLAVLSAEGVEYALSDALVLAPDEVHEDQNFAIDPSGIVYRRAEGAAQPVAGARVFLVDIDDTSGGEDGTDVDPLLLFGGQQGQTTTEQGFYRFDVRTEALPGRFRIRVEPPTPTLVFPSEQTRPSGASDAEPLGEFAVVGPDGRVVPADFPDLEGDTTYFLRFSLTPSSVAITNNHIPLDRIEERIRLTKEVDRRVAEMGEVVTYTVTIDNPTDQSFRLDDGGASLHDTFPKGVRPVFEELSGGVRLVEAWRRTTADGLLEAGPLLSSSLSGRQLRFDAFRLPARSRTTIRYYGVIGISAKGHQVNRAQLYWGGTAISNRGEATLRVVQDPIFEQGTVVGTVFCDANGDGERQRPEAGLAGARVYLDTGYYVDSDPDGKFHFRGVTAGWHMLKLDLNTVPPASEPTTDVVRQLTTTRGVLSKIDFGIRCAIEEVRPEEVTVAAAPPQAAKELPQIVVTVDPTLPAVALEGEAQSLPLVDAVLTPEGATPDFEAGTGLAIGGAGPLTWHVRRPSRTRIARWQISIFDLSGKEAWRVEGTGRPPLRIPWAFENEPALAVGQIYAYRIVAETPGGDVGEGRWRRLEVRAGKGGGDTEQIALWQEDLFAGATEQPLPLLRQRIRDLLEQLRARGDVPPLEIEVHTHNGGKRSARLIATQRRAAVIQKLFVEAGVPPDRVRAVGLGDTQPMVPNINRKAKDLNRRVVVKVVRAAGVEYEAMPPIAYAPALRINGDALAVGESSVEKELSVAVGDEVEVEIREANGRRVAIRRTYPFKRGDTTVAEAVSIPVSGDLKRGELTVGPDTISLGLLTAECGAERVRYPLTDGRLVEPVQFSIHSHVPLASWLVRLFNPEGTVLTDITGVGAPDPTIPWAGLSPAGDSVVRVGTYGYRCMLTDADENRAVLPMEQLELSAGTDVPEDARAGEGTTSGAASDAELQTLTGDAYPADPIAGPAAEALDALADRLTFDPGLRARIEVHDNAEGGKMQAQIRTARLADTIRRYLLGKGVAEGAITIVARGALEPLMVGTSRRALRTNRRVTVAVSGPPPAPAPPPSEMGKSSADLIDPFGTPAAARARIAGENLSVGADGRFEGTVTVPHDALVAVDLADGTGRSALYRVALFEGRVVGAEPSVIPVGAPPGPDAGPHLGSDPDSLRAGAPATPAVARSSEPPPPPESVDTEASQTEEVAPPLVDVPSTEDPLARPPLPPLEERAAASLPPSGPARLHSPSGPAVLHSPSGPPAVQARAGPAQPGETDDATERANGAAGPVTLAAGDAPFTRAAQLVVWLPPEGVALRGERLTVVGRAHEGNRVRVNGKGVPLDEDGRFFTTVVLPAGDAQVDVTSQDDAGNVARVRRHYRVPELEWFLLAMADGAAGVGARMEGMSDETTAELNDDVYLHGRAVGYLKGRIKGSALWAALPFEEVRLTAHVDSGKEEDRDILRQLIDPDRYYPVYGDSAEEVQDVSSRWKLYVLLEADRSRLKLGNFKVAFEGGELFRYQRSHFGALLDVNHEVLPGQDTQVRAFVASHQAGIRHRQLLLQGTGGAMFFLRDGAVVEGSEQVKLVVRDEITGARLFEVTQVRDADYTINYRDGHLVFTQPIPSTVMSGWRLNQNPPRTLEGHPVFVEVQYDYDAVFNDESNGAFAAQVAHSFDDMATVRAGVIDEDRGDGTGQHYRLWGADASVNLLQATKVRGEIAYSQYVDGDHLASYDGGLTFGRLGTPDLSEPGLRGRLPPGDVDGWAARLSVAGDVREITGQSGPTESGDWLPYSAYLQHQTPGFYAGTAILEQGQTKAGGQARLLLTAADSVRVRHDGVLSWVFLEEEDRRLVRQITSAAYEHRDDGWMAGVEVGNNYGHDGVDGATLSTLTLFGEKTVLPRLVASLEQEVVAIDSGDRLASGADRVATTLGAKYRLGEHLWVTATESLRYSGANSTQIGLKTRIGDNLSFYASERLTAGAGRPVSSTVVGGESTAIPGSRSYAEYQLDHLSSGRNGRAVFGIDNTFTVVEGLDLQLAYERAQLVGDRSRPLTGSSVSSPGVLSNGSGPLTPDTQFAASGFSSGAVFPVGVSSRDALALGLQTTAARRLKGGLRFEMRYDRGDRSLGAPDRLVLFSQLAAEMRARRDLVALLRLRGGSVRNLDPDLNPDTDDAFFEGQFLDISGGLALRPRDHNRFGGLLKWTRRYAREPARADRSQFQLQVADVLSLEPWYEIGWGLQAVGKIALKLYEVVDADLPTVRSLTMLSLVRLNYHLTSTVDAGVEYRWLSNVLIDQVEHGALLELAWIPVQHVSVGVGYNFTRFTDDLLANANPNDHGVFLRVTGRY